VWGRKKKKDSKIDEEIGGKRRSSHAILVKRKFQIGGKRTRNKRGLGDGKDATVGGERFVYYGGGKKKRGKDQAKSLPRRRRRAVRPWGYGRRRGSS